MQTATESQQILILFIPLLAVREPSNLFTP